MSDFIREAILDKINRIRHPEVFESKGDFDIISKQYRYLLETIIDNSKKIDFFKEKAEERAKIIMEIKEVLDTYQEYVKQFELIELESNVIELFENKNVLKPKKVYKLFSNKDKFEMDMKTGGFRLKHD